MSITGLATGAAPNDEAIEYNGFRFPRGAKTLAFTCKPIKDAAQRTIIYSEFLVTIEAYLNLAPANADAITQNALSLLTQPAAGFKYYGRGYGDFRVNLQGAQDCSWGPFPEMIETEPVGGEYTTRIVWSLRFNIPTCGDARYTGPMEFNYGTSVEVDQGGISKRVYKGFIRIAQTRLNQSDILVRKSADEWREKINPPLLNGFRRIPGVFDLSTDKCKLDFSIVDEEFQGTNVPPPGVIEAEARHSYTTAVPGRIFEWIGSLSATYDIQKGNNQGISEAIRAFGKLATDRLDQFLALARGAGGAIGAAAGGIAGGVAAAGAGGGGIRLGVADVFSFGAFRIGAELGKLIAGGGGGGSIAAITANGGIAPCIVPVSFSVADGSIYGKMRVELDMKYRVAGASLAQILSIGGLWRSVPGSNWGQWTSSIKGAIGSRGGSNLVLFTPGEEQLVGLCSRIPIAAPVAPPPQKQEIDLRGGPRNYQIELRGGGFVFPKPTAASSWIDYVGILRSEEDSGKVIGKTLPSVPIPAPTSTRSVFGDAGAAITAGVSGRSTVSRNTIENPAPRTTDGQTFVQRRVGGVLYFFFSGYAIRAGFPIPTPTVLKINGNDPVSVNRPDCGECFEQTIAGWGGVDGDIPIYAARWNLRYVLA